MRIKPIRLGGQPRTIWASAVNEKKPTYRIEIKKIGDPRSETFGWEIYRNWDILPTLRSEQLFGSRTAGLADANRSRLQLIDTN